MGDRFADCSYTVWLLCSFQFISVLELKELYICEKKAEFIIRRSGCCSFSEFSSTELEQESQVGRSGVQQLCCVTIPCLMHREVQDCVGCDSELHQQSCISGQACSGIAEGICSWHCRMSWVLSPGRVPGQWSSALLMNNSFLNQSKTLPQKNTPEKWIFCFHPVISRVCLAYSGLEQALSALLHSATALRWKTKSSFTPNVIVLSW